MKKKDCENVLWTLEIFDELIDDLEDEKFNKEAMELLEKIFKEWAKHKSKDATDEKNKRVAMLIKGFSSYFHERIPVDTKRSAK